MRRTGFLAALAAVSAGLLLLRTADPAGVIEERIWRHRNLGKAHYENPTALPQAVEEFRQALELAPDSARERLNYGLALLRAGRTEEGIAELAKVQKEDPTLPHTWFNLGIAYKKQRQYDKAIEQFQGMLRLLPDDPVSHYNLGLLYKLKEKTGLALQEFEITSKIDPDLVAPRFQIFNTLRENDRQEEAERALALFKTAKDRKTEEDTEDMEWNVYAEIYDPTDVSADATPPPGPLRFENKPLRGRADPKTAGIATLHAGGGDRLDLLVWSSTGARLYRGGTVPEAPSPLTELRGIVSIAPGDYDNDGLPDLCVVVSDGVLLFHNDHGAFRQDQALPVKGRFRKAVWLDYDHDYDLDLFLLGDDAALLRNQGAAGFADKTAGFPFVKGRATDAALFHLISDSKQMDLIVSYEDRDGVVYRDRLLANYEAVPVSELPRGARSLRQVDIDQNGWMDLAFSAAGEAGFLLNKDGRLRKGAGVPARGPIVLADLENRAAPDLVAGGAVYRNMGAGNYDERPSHKLVEAAAWAAGDFTLDGKTDLAAVGDDGSLHLFVNTSVAKNNWVGIRLAGVKNLKLPYGTEVEVKAGPLYQKQAYDGTALLFGLRGRKQIDTVRLNWANGLVQNQPNELPGRYLSVREAPRLSGSCPMIFTWNGRKFEFLTDVLGVAPLGASAGDGTFFPTDHDEYVQIPAESLVARNGRYEIRITEELGEVTYLDQVRLLAVDHPAGIEVFSNDKWKSPPYPEFRLFGVSRRLYPRSARDHRGRDVLERVVRRDRRYADGFDRNHAGVAEPHSLELDFGSGAATDNQAVLVLNGWVDWADGSVFVSQAQQGKALVPPYLQVKDAAGRWRTVIADMGMPSGKTKTIAVDLAGKFLSASREVRIVTSMCVYWDEIFLGDDNSAPAARLSALDTARADLRFRGFSGVRIHPERKQPEYFLYDEVRLDSPWRRTPGVYTGYGPVDGLLREVDDRFVILGSGDELSLWFDAGQLPALPAGRRRDFLLLVDGWTKDQDANTAFSQTVEPLPSHRMEKPGTLHPFTGFRLSTTRLTHPRQRTAHCRKPVNGCSVPGFSTGSSPRPRLP